MSREMVRSTDRTGDVHLPAAELVQEDLDRDRGSVGDAAEDSSELWDDHVRELLLTIGMATAEGNELRFLGEIAVSSEEVQRCGTPLFQVLAQVGDDLAPEPIHTRLTLVPCAEFSSFLPPNLHEVQEK